MLIKALRPLRFNFADFALKISYLCNRYAEISPLQSIYISDVFCRYI